MLVNSQMSKAAVAAARKAGALIRKNSSRNSVRYTLKDRYNLVTKTDTAAETIILAALQKQFPDHSFFSEEGGMMRDRNVYHWVIDPLDGTTNFTKKIQHCVVSIALFYKSQCILGVVYQPFTNELFLGVREKGATRNKRKIRVSKINELTKAIIAFNKGNDKGPMEHVAKTIEQLSKKIKSLRVLGATALDICYVACGKLDAIVLPGSALYDHAAGALIAEEAGAAATTFRGKLWGKEIEDIVISNKFLHAQLIKSLKKI